MSEMETLPQKRQITLASGRTLELHELSFDDFAELEAVEKDGAGTARRSAFTLWLLARKSGLTSEQIQQKQWAISLEEMSREAGPNDWMRNKAVIDSFLPAAPAPKTETESSSPPSPSST